MGHAAQDLNGDLEDFKKDPELYRDQAEANNLLKYENPISKELGEFTRKNYYDATAYYRLSNSTDWGILKTIRPWYYYLWPGNWGKPSKKFVNKNKWKP